MSTVVTAARAIALFKTNNATPAQSIADSAADVASLLDQLRPLVLANGIASIALTDTLPLSITYASFVTDAVVLAKLTSGYSVVLSGVPAAQTAAIQSSARVTSFSVSDTASAVASAFDALNGASRLQAISLTNGTMLTITAAQFAVDTTALGKLPSNYQLTVTGVSAANAAAAQMASHVGAFSVTGTAAQIIANFATLNAAGKMSAITLTDGTTLTITYTQFMSAAAAIGRLASNVTLIVTGVTAAGAASVQASSRVRSFSVTDTAAQIGAGLNTLNTATKLTGITLVNVAPIPITFSQMTTDVTAIARLPSNTMFTVAGVTAALASAAQSSARVAAFSVNDTSANVAANLSTLKPATKLQTVLLTDSAAMALTAAQVTTYASVLSKISPNYGLAISAVTAAGAAETQANAHVRSFSVSDNAANIALYLNVLAGYTKLTSIVLTDSLPLAMTFAQLSGDAGVLAKIGGNWSAVVTGVGAVAAAGAQASSRVRNFTITDTAAAVTSVLDALNSDTKLTAITLTTSTPLVLSVHQLTSNASVLGKIAPNTQLTISGAAVSDLSAVQTNSHVKTIQVTDTAANILSALATLNNNTSVTSIALSGGTTLAVSYAQFTAYGAVLGKLNTADSLSVTGVAAANAQAVQANARVSSFSVSDTAAAVVANLDGLNGDEKLASITATDTRTLSLPYGKFIADTSALGKLSGTYTFLVTGATAAGATVLAANTHVSQFTVGDTLSNIGAKLDQLEAAVKAGKLTAINVTDTGGIISISSAQSTADADAIALLHGSYTIRQPGSSSGATINLIWGSRALAAPAAFRSAITYAAQYIQSFITNPITINLNVGYGEVGGSTLGNGVLGAAGPYQGIGVTYAQFKNALPTQVISPNTQTIVANLSATDPSHGGTIYLASAEEKALGLMSATSAGVDGIMGFAADPNGTLFTYDPNNRAVSGKYDLIGVVEHELSHALGRITMGGTYGRWISALDVFRFSAPGVHNPTVSGSAYYSINNGATNLNWFAATSDLADWASSAGNDVNNAYSNGSVVNQFTATDLSELNALGFSTTGTPSASTVGQNTIHASSGLNSPSLTFLGTPPVAFMTDDLPSIGLSLNPASGIEEIAQFEYGVNELRIDLQGINPSAFVAFDTSVGGVHAIALANSADTTHGLILTNMAAEDTAADLMAHHLTFSDGNAIIA